MKHLVSWPRTIACCRAEMLNYVVGEQACCVKGDYETSLGIPETHDGICHTKHRGHLYEKVRELLRGIIVEAPLKIEERFRPREYQSLDYVNQTTSWPVMTFVPLHCRYWTTRFGSARASEQKHIYQACWSKSGACTINHAR